MRLKTDRRVAASGVRFIRNARRSPGPSEREALGIGIRSIVSR